MAARAKGALEREQVPSNLYRLYLVHGLVPPAAWTDLAGTVPLQRVLSLYKRLAPGVVDELKKVIPKSDSGRRKGTLAQGLTRNVGYPKLREHLGATVAFMKLSRDYHDFIDKMDTHYPRFGE